MLSYFLTLQEKKVILFLFFLGFLGLGLNFLSKQNDSIKKVFQEDFSFKVNINQANKEELMTLPGIGEKLAERIIQYRRKKYRFLFPEELKKIKGISNSTYNKIKDRITVD